MKKITKPSYNVDITHDVSVEDTQITVTGAKLYSGIAVDRNDVATYVSVLGRKIADNIIDAMFDKHNAVIKTDDGFIQLDMVAVEMPTENKKVSIFKRMWNKLTHKNK